MNELAKLIKAASFSAKKHRFQRRKGTDGEPYINHPLGVANYIAEIGKVNDVNVLCAAILHDTIEDTETNADEITELFGSEICGMVLEVTDDKLLSKAETKQKQIEHAPHLSNGAKLVKLADKIYNVNDVINNPSPEWDDSRREAYVNWSVEVVKGLRGVNTELEDYFDQLVKTAKFSS